MWASEGERTSPSTHPRSSSNGRAEISTRVRLLQTQVVIAAAEMSDGSVRVGKGRCKIIGGAGACG